VQTQCLVTRDRATRINFKVRFLQHTPGHAKETDSIGSSAIEREVEIAGLRLDDLVERAHVSTFDFPEPGPD
jgi:hypothetical protein